MISVNDVTFGYQKKANIYQNLNLKIEDGDRLAILGFNGAGKSTLMKIIMGIIRPQNGNVLIAGMNVRKKRIKIMKKIGVVWGQKPSLWWDISVLKSYKTLEKIYRIPHNEFLNTLKFFDEQLNLSQFWNSPLRNLSLGQRVKAEIVGALLHSPSILILDEPFIGLDFITRGIIIKILNNYINKNKCTLVLTSHNIDDVNDLCERMILINNGDFIYHGEIKELLDKNSDVREITLTHTSNSFIIDEELNDFVRMESINTITTKLIIDSTKIPITKVIQSILNGNVIIDFKIEGNSLEYIIEKLVNEESKKEGNLNE